MNSSSVYTLQSVRLQWTLQQAAYIIDNYLIGTAGGIVVHFNLLFSILLLNKQLKHRIYNYFWCRTICNLIVCLLASGYVTNCNTCLEVVYWHVAYKWFVIGVNLRVAGLAPFNCDIYLLLNRFCEIIKNNSFFTKMSKKVNLFICFFSSTCLSIPFYLS